MSLQRNKVHHVFTIARVAVDLGEDEDWLFDIAGDMEPEDGVIWIYGPDDQQDLALTEEGIDNLVHLIAMHRNQTD